MLRASLRNLLAHKLRLGLTAVSIVLAVAFISGTYVFTDSLRASLDTLIQQDQPDVTVRPVSADFTREFRGAGRVATVPTDLVEPITEIRGVASVVSQIQVPNVVVLDADGLPLGAGSGGFGGGAAVARSWVDEPALNSNTLLDGAAPRDGAVAVDTGTAEQLDAGVGDSVTLLLPDGKRRSFDIDALVQLRAGGGFGVSFVYWDFATAQKLFLRSGEATSIAVLARPLESQDDLRDAIVALLPPGVDAITGQEQASAVSQQLDSGLGFLSTFLLVFAVVSIFVATFLIYNTFSMLVAQRTRELALLRAVGASRGQVLRSILLEAVVVGAVASTVGIGVGAVVAVALQRLFEAAGAPLPAGDLVFVPRTVAVALSVGMVITVASALLPARRASQIAPVAAMREQSPPRRESARRVLAGCFLLGVGLGLAAMAPRLVDFDTTDAAVMAGVAAAGVLLAVLALSPELARPATGVIAAMFRGVSGRLARGNARRNPRRTAATSGALTIGVSLMTAISVLASSTQASVSGLVDEVIGADFVLTGYGFQPFPASVGQDVAGTPGVAGVAVVRQAPMRAPGTGDTLLSGVEPQRIQQALSLTVPQGSLDALGPDTVALDTDTAAQIRAGVGTVVRVLSLAGPVDLRVVAVYEPAGGFMGYVTDLPTVTALGAADSDSVAYVIKEPAAVADDVQAALSLTLRAYPNVQLLDQSGFKQQINDQIGQLLNFLFALLVLAVVIALLGIVNTLALSVFERTREIGLLRAVGMSRGGIRRIIVVEAFIIAVFGAVLGLVVGIGFGALMQRILADEGIDRFALAPGQLVAFVILAALGGVLAALWPAWRGSRLRILDAIAAE